MTKEEIKDFINLYYKYNNNIDNKWDIADDEDYKFWNTIFKDKPSSYPMDTYPDMYSNIPKPKVRIVNA